MLNKSRFTKTIAALGVAGAFVCGSAYGAPFASAIVPGSNQISDDNAEIVIKFDATLNGGAGGYRAFVPGVDTIGSNDILVGIVGITSFPTGALGTSSALYNEVTGIYAVQVTTNPVLAPLPAVSCGSALLTTCSFYPTFGAVTSGVGGLSEGIALMNAIYGTAVPLIGNTTANTIGSFFEDSTADFNRNAPGTLTQKFDQAYDGSETQRIVIDLIAANGDSFVTTAPADPTQLGLLAPGAFGGSFGGDATISYYDLPGWQLGADMQIVGNLYNGNNQPFGIWSDSTYTFDAQRIPEPGVLALLGLGLVGFGVGVRRKNLSA